METITTKLVNATPRSPKYEYYSTGGSGYTNTKSDSQEMGDDTDSPLYYVATAADLPAPGDENHLYIVADEQTLYYYDADAGEYKLATSAVKKIIAGSNVSIAPTTGVGNVTVNAADPPVTKIVAGSNVSISPTSGLGDVTVNAASPGVTKIVAGSNVSISPATGLGDVTVNAASPGVTKIVAGTGVAVSPTTGTGEVTVSVDTDWLTDFVNAIVNP